MQFVPRLIAPQILRAARGFPAIVLTGPRRAGKTALLRRLFPRAAYVALDAPDVRERANADPRSFLESLAPPAILDEIQNAPALFAFLKEVIDRAPRRTGQWLLSGSQEAPLMQHVTESLAGRVAVLGLWPFSRAESPRVDLLRGGFPEVVARPSLRGVWFSSYVQTYLERDVRAVLNVRDLGLFRRFLGLLAARHGQILNRTDLAGPLGLSVPALGAWLHVLEVTGHVLIVPPYFQNVGKRLLKSPKVYLADSGLVCHLLGITTANELERSPFLGVVAEGFVATEIAKAQMNRGVRREVYFFRDQQGFEVDFLAPVAGTTWIVEVKASRTVMPRDARSVAQLRRRLTGNRRAAVAFRAARNAVATGAIAPGVEALTMERLIERLNDR
ncbi:MAG TPA: ATP-binding protein [Gemmatimonadaceae bacterium]